MSFEFHEVEAADTIRLEPYFKMRPTFVCDSTPFDSFLWQALWNVEYCERDGKALLWRMRLDGEWHMAVPSCREEDLPYYFEESLRYSHEVLGSKLSIYLADEDAVRILNPDPERFTVTEDVDSADYVYSAESLRTLAGKNYHKKKNHVNAFLKEYGDRAVYCRIDCGHTLDIWNFLDRWEQMKGEEVGEHLDAEAVGLHNVLMHCSEMKVKIVGVFIDGQLEAFTMGTYNEAKKMAVIHVEKANPEIRGLYAYINQKFLQEEFPDAELVNREDDVGLPGLRKAKESYHPLFMARKFHIREK